MCQTQRSFLYFLAIATHTSVSLSDAAEDDIRLATPCYGKVEIKYNNTWGTVCDDNWSLKDTKVVCKQLDCGTALEAPQLTRHGQRIGTIWHGDFNCSGSESSLRECWNSGFGTQSCGRDRDVGVVCLGSVQQQQPNITLTSPNGGLVWNNEVAEVIWGYSFVITCFTNFNYTQGHFILIFSDSNKTESAVNKSASFHFPFAKSEDQGHYRCAYEITLPTRKFKSKESKPVHVVIALPLMVLITSVSSGILSLLLAVFLVVCLVLRRRRQYKLPETVVQTQMAVTNSYEGDEEDEEERDYVNIEQMDNTRQMNPAGGVEEDSCSDDCDYENVECDNDGYSKAMEVSVCVDDNTEENEDEEDTSEDENDYVNLAESVAEDSLDIYGEEQDFYSNI
ncbi:uncharacterized protein PAE49_024077 [Odontesthes bonariensis]|uniref:uncharacterized protein LOC142372624 n=1 Tax=Odontesthes bonariensis TaxID=219752 RepID=UPI003F580E88